MEIVLSAVFMKLILSVMMNEGAPYSCEIVKKERGRTYIKLDTADSFKIIKRKLMGYIFEKDPQIRILVFAFHPVVDGKPDWFNYD